MSFGFLPSNAVTTLPMFIQPIFPSQHAWGASSNHAWIHGPRPADCLWMFGTKLGGTKHRKWTINEIFLTTLSWMITWRKMPHHTFGKARILIFFKVQPRKNARDPYVSTRNPHCSLHFCWHISAQINQRDPTESPIKDHLKFQNAQKKKRLK